VHGKTDDAVDKTRFILIYRKGVLLDWISLGVLSVFYGYIISLTKNPSWRQRYDSKRGLTIHSLHIL
jgi:hypothetical protein